MVRSVPGICTWGETRHDGTEDGPCVGRSDGTVRPEVTAPGQTSTAYRRRESAGAPGAYGGRAGRGETSGGTGRSALTEYRGRPWRPTPGLESSSKINDCCQRHSAIAAMVWGSDDADEFALKEKRRGRSCECHLKEGRVRRVRRRAVLILLGGEWAVHAHGSG